MKDKKTCQACLWRDQCEQEEICEHYTPIEDEEAPVDLENQRGAFLQEWNEYITKIND